MRRLIFFFAFVIVAVSAYLLLENIFSIQYKQGSANEVSATPTPIPTPVPLDVKAYEIKIFQLANATTSIPQLPLFQIATTTLVKTASSTATTTVKIKPKTPLLWPVKAANPIAGGLIPFNRIVAYYGNFYSTAMGILGQYGQEEVLTRLRAEVKKWQDADPNTPVVPAIHYIADTAQASAGADGKYLARMPDDQIDKALAMAKEVNGILILDLQVAQSNVQTEVPLLEKYLKLPNVHLGIDPEFAMGPGQKPGRVIGTLDASDINFAAQYLAKLVRDNNLPPKILVIHRFTLPMVTNYKKIEPLPEVQVVMDMDGWGSEARKETTYQKAIYEQPVQFTGFKLFYKNDFREASSSIMTPAQVLKLKPQPIYIQYQ